MADIAKAKRNVSRMIDGGASESEIDAYLSSEGLSADALRGGAAVQGQPAAEKSERGFVNDSKAALLKLGRDFGGSIPFIDKPGQYKSNALAIPGDIGALVSAAARPAIAPVSNALYDAGLRPSVGEGVGTGFRYRQTGRDEAADLLTETALTAASLAVPAKAGPPVRGRPIPGRTSPARPVPVRQQRVQALQDAGVDNLTPGQLMGGTVKNLEDAAATTSGSVRRAQVRANENLNTAVMNDAISPIGGRVQGAGREAVESMHTQVGDALDTSFGNANFAPDAVLQTDISQSARGLLPSSRAEALDLTREFITDASSPGGLSEAFANLNKMKVQASARGDASLADFIHDLQQSALANLDRTTPGAAGEVRAARDAFRRSVVPERASAMVGAQEGVFDGNQLVSAVKASDRTARKNAFAQGKAQYQPIAEAAKDVMGKSMGSSGTAERLALSDPFRFTVLTARNLALKAVYNRPVIRLLNQISRATTPATIQRRMTVLRELAKSNADAAKALQALSASGAASQSGVALPAYSQAAAAREREQKDRRRK